MSPSNENADFPNRRIRPLPSRPKKDREQSGKLSTPGSAGQANIALQFGRIPSATDLQQVDSPFQFGGGSSAAQFEQFGHFSQSLLSSPAKSGETNSILQFPSLGSSTPSGSFTFRVPQEVPPPPSSQPEDRGPKSLPAELDSTPLLILLDDPNTTRNQNLPTAVTSPEVVPPSRVRSASNLDIPSVSFTRAQSADSDRLPRSPRLSDASIASVFDSTSTPYDVADEQQPVTPYFSDTFQRALKKGLDIAKRSETVLKSLGGFSDSGGHVGKLLADAKGLSGFRCADTKTIAFLGDSGEGKSSLINSLLHFPDIAATGDLGAACTSVVTEYKQRRVDQEEPIVIEVEYLSESKIEYLLKELVVNFRRIFLPGVESDDTDPSDYAKWQRESEQAWSALEAAFGHQTVFNRRFLSDMSDGAQERVTKQLIQWSKDIKWPESGTPGKWTSTAQTADECFERTKTFMGDKFWPFTEIIRIYVDALVLRTGIVLADLPGLQDTNLARVQATQKYLMRCDNVFVVTNIARAITDSSLKSSIYNVIARHVPLEWEESAGVGLKVAVVCTKSEIINEKTARREFCGPGKRIEPSVMEELERAIEDAKRNDNHALKKELKRKREALFIEARNSLVKKGLQAAYASKMPGSLLEVFCVSNTLYEKYTGKGCNDLVRSMITTSGIPELRRFCQSITSDSRLLEAKHFLQSKLSSLLNSMEVWSNSATVQPDGDEYSDEESMALDREEVTKIKKKILKHIKEFEEDFDASLNDCIVKLFEHRESHWEESAKKKGLEWCEWHWSQYNAWCMNDGDHRTGKRDRVNWNGELIWRMRTELDSQWGLLTDTISDRNFNDLLVKIKAQFRTLTSFLRAQGLSFALTNGIDHRFQDIKYRFGGQKDKLERELRLIRSMAFEPNESSFIVEEMVPAYRAACQEKGTGKAQRQRRHVQGRITDGTLFANIFFSISSAIRKAAKKRFCRLREIVKDNFESIMEVIDMEVPQYDSEEDSDDDDDDDEDYEEEKRLKACVASEVKVLKAEHKHVLESISHL